MVTLAQSSPGDLSARAPQSKTATVMIGVRGECFLSRAVSIDGAQAEIQRKDHGPGRAPVGDDGSNIGSFQMSDHRYQWMSGNELRSWSCGQDRSAHRADVPTGRSLALE